MSPDQEPEVDPRRKEPEKPERFPVRLPVIETQSGQIDVLSRLLKDRILLLGQQVRERERERGSIRATATCRGGERVGSGTHHSLSPSSNLLHLVDPLWLACRWMMRWPISW